MRRRGRREYVIDTLSREEEEAEVRKVEREREGKKNKKNPTRSVIYIISLPGADVTALRVCFICGFLNALWESKCFLVSNANVGLQSFNDRPSTVLL